MNREGTPAMTVTEAIAILTQLVILATVIGGLVNISRKQDKNHVMLNSELSEFRKLMEKEAHARGMKDQRDSDAEITEKKEQKS